VSGPVLRRPDGVEIAIRVQPGARQTALVGLYGNEVKIRVAAPPVGGKANTALIQFLAERIGVPPSRLRIVAGAASRRKRVLVEGSTPEAARAGLDLD